MWKLDDWYITFQIDRLTKNSDQRVPDSKRTQKDSMYATMGILNSFTWRGYN